MVVIILKKPAAGSRPAVNEKRTFGAAPGLPDLEAWAKEAASRAGYGACGVELLLDKVLLTAADCSSRIAALGEGQRLVVRLNVQVEQLQRCAVQLSSHVQQLSQGPVLASLENGLAKWKEVQSFAGQLRTKGYQQEADRLLSEARAKFGRTLQRLLTLRMTGRELLQAFRDFNAACGEGDVQGAKASIRSAGRRGQDLGAESEGMQRELASFVEDLMARAKRLDDECDLHHFKQVGFGVTAGAAAVGTVGAAGATAATGLTTTVTTGLLGWGTANVWNPMGVCCLVAAGALTVGAAAFGAASVYNSYEVERTGLERDAAEGVRGTVEVHAKAWQGISLTAGVVEQSLEGLDEMDLQCHHTFQAELARAAQFLADLMHSQDEYLVRLSESGLSPGFNARAVLGEEAHSRIRAITAQS